MTLTLAYDRKADLERIRADRVAVCECLEAALLEAAGLLDPGDEWAVNFKRQADRFQRARSTLRRPGDRQMTDDRREAAIRAVERAMRDRLQWSVADTPQEWRADAEAVADAALAALDTRAAPERRRERRFAFQSGQCSRQ